jgi:hypothetical protein
VRRRQARHSAAIARDTTLTQAQIARGVVRRALAKDGVTQAEPPAELRRRVANLASGTYVDDILAEQDSTLYRWPERLSDALRVYIEPTSAVAGWNPQYPELARMVFDEWGEAGFPIRFAFVYDSTNADLTIGWRDRFPASDGQRVGVTERVQTSEYLIGHASVVVALHDSAGRVFSPPAVAGILRHEIGHALGLNHANDSRSVMFHESATPTIGASDRATLRLLYLVPPGSLKER